MVVACVLCLFSLSLVVVVFLVVLFDCDWARDCVIMVVVCWCCFFLGVTVVLVFAVVVGNFVPVWYASYRCCHCMLLVWSCSLLLSSMVRLSTLLETGLCF